MQQQLAFLGLGVMGAPMAANLAQKGYPVRTWNRTPNPPGIEAVVNAGAISVATLREAVTAADVIFLCVADVPDVEAVILGTEGIINYAKPGSLIVDFSTIGSRAARHIGNQLKQHDFRFLDAPISGGDIGAKNATLTIMVGGEEKDFQECQPYLEAMGKTIRLCGSVGSGQAVKLCNQVLVAGYMVTLCEAIKMAEKQGIDPTLIIEICSTGAAGSWALSNLAPKIVAADFKPGFMIKHILKDLRLVQEMLQESEENLPGVELADKLFKIVAELDNGQGANQGTQAMIRSYQ